MDGQSRQRLSPEEAKAHLRDVARGNGRPSPGGVGRAVVSTARQRPLAAVGMAFAAGIGFGASRRVRAELVRAVLRLLR